MSATIKDVAKLAGVSKTTVSRVIMNSPNIKESTRQKVSDAIGVLDYRPNAIARAMITKKTGNIGFIINKQHKPVLAHPFYAPILEAIVETTAIKGYSIFISSDYDITSKNGDIFIQKKVDGIILASSISEKIINAFKKNNIPVVLINNETRDEDVVCIINDDYNGAYKAVEYLVKKGYRNIGILCGPMEHISYRKRLQGYTDVMNDYKIDTKSENIIISYHSTLIAGYEGMKKMLVREYPRAVFCSNDMMAIGAIKAIKEANIRIPEDIAIIGFDNNDYCNIVEPGITTINVDKEKIGRLAVENLINMINGKGFNERIITVDTSLIIRESS